MLMTYTMKHVVENCDVSANTPRYYETEGILKNIARDLNGRRIYSDDNIKWLDFIRSPDLRECPSPKLRSTLNFMSREMLHLNKEKK